MITNSGHLWVDDLLCDVVEIVPAVIGPEPRVEGSGESAHLPVGALYMDNGIIDYPVSS